MTLYYLITNDKKGLLLNKAFSQLKRNEKINIVITGCPKEATLIVNNASGIKYYELKGNKQEIEAVNGHNALQLKILDGKAVTETYRFDGFYINECDILRDDSEAMERLQELREITNGLQDENKLIKRELLEIKSTLNRWIGEYNK